MEKTIVIRLYPIGSTKNTAASVVSAAPASESEVEARIIKVIKHGTNTISGIPLSGLNWGDTFFVHGIPCVNRTETLGALKRSLFGERFGGKPFSFDDVDAYEPEKVTQPDVQESTKNATSGESQKSDTTMSNDSRIVKGIKKGSTALTGILFRNLKVGDIFFQNGKPITVGEDAHLSGDASYDGYLVYDRNGDSYFPEDVDLFEIQHQKASISSDGLKDVRPAGKGSCDNDRILVKRSGSLTPYSVFSHNLEVGDVVTAINGGALRAEDSDRCAIVRRDGALATITVSDLQVNDKVLALL